MDIYKLRVNGPTWVPLSLGAADSVQSLRASLDQLAYATAIASGENGKNAMFPFGESLAQLAKTHSEKKGKSRDIPKSVFDLMLGFRPFKGGNELLIGINNLANRHKHEILNPMAIAVRDEQIVMGPTGTPLRWDYAKKELVVGSVPKGETIEQRLSFNACVEFPDMGGLSGIPAEGVLDDMCQLAESIRTAVVEEARRLNYIQ